MKKIIALLLILSVISGMMASCELFPKTTTTSAIPTTSTTSPQETPVCAVHTDADSDFVCDICGKVLENDEFECTEHKDADGDYICDECGAELERPTTPPDTECTEHKDADGDYICDECGAELERPTTPPDTECTEHKDANTDYICDECGASIEIPDDPFIEPDQPDLPDISGELEVTVTGYSFETLYFEWKPFEGAESYNVYCDGVKVDAELIRSYGSYYRCDILGLTAKEYTVDIVPVYNSEELDSAKTTFKKTTVNHIREGFSWVNGTASGAYNEDGTLKSDARVIYVTNENKDTVSMSIQTGKSAYTEAVGVQNILTLLKKGYETKPICIRFIGNITDPAVLENGDLVIDCGETKFTGGITIEGVGNDATFNGFGLRIKNSSNIEIRNLGFMNCNSDEGDSIGLQQNNHHIWVHNCDIFYGEAGSDADQNKGDGALDTKKSTYVTISFNHFYDTGKSNLLGNTGESEENYITYHHNWYDHSDSRHPRVRTCSVHVYNNFFDGISKYGIGATEGSSIFAENNYFLNTNYPMLISMQGSDIANDGEGTFSSEDGGIIKAFGNVIAGTGHGVISYQQNSTQFDCYLASARDEKVPSNVLTYQGGTDYNNFDTDSSLMYAYSAQTAEQAMNTVKEYAGRVQGGDFKWTFTDADNSSYNVNTELKSALLAYSGALVSTNVSGDSDNGDGEEDTENNGGSDGDSVVTPTPQGAIIHNFHESGKTSDFFTISGNLSSSKGTVTYNGLSLTQCLKMESLTSITFTLTESRTLTLVFGTASKTVKVDGTKYTTDSNGIVTVELDAGAHTVTKGDSINLYYMMLE